MKKGKAYQVLCLCFVLLLAGCGLSNNSGKNDSNNAKRRDYNGEAVTSNETHQQSSSDSSREGDTSFDDDAQESNNQRSERYISIWHGDVADAYESGYGTKDDPYIIKEANQLAYLSEQVNLGKTFDGQYYELVSDIILNDPETLPECENSWDSVRSCAADIFLSSLNKWTPIGTPLPAILTEEGIQSTVWLLMPLRIGNILHRCRGQPLGEKNTSAYSV